MPIKLIPDLEWKFIENISVMKSDKGVTIYCIKEAEDEHEDTQVSEVSEPNTDVKANKNIKPVVTGTVEAPRATQTSGETNSKISEDTEIDVSDRIVAEQVEVTHTIDITELITGIPEPTLETTSRESKRSTITLPGSPQRKTPEIQNKSRDNTEAIAEQAVKKTHKYPKADNSIINKIFSVFRQAKESLDTIPM